MRTSRRPLVLGHRGYRARFPENTLLAFREALAAGADGIECDLQKSADGRYVVIHDPRTGRVAGVRTWRSHAPALEHFAHWTSGTERRLSTLEELLGALPRGTYLDLELKEETLQAADCEPSWNPWMRPDHGDLMISSFEPRLSGALPCPGFHVGFLVGEEAASRGLLSFAATLARLRPQYVNLPIDMVRRLGARRSHWIARFLRLVGFSLLFWTVNARAEVLFAAKHARIIVTDQVESAIHTLTGIHQELT